MSGVKERKAPKRVTGRQDLGIRSELVKAAALARFFEKKPGEINRMREEDGLPFVMLPGENEPSYRYALPEVHAWLMKRATGQSLLGDYERFKAMFYAAQERRGKTVK